MQIPIRWLETLVDIQGISPEDIAYGLTMAGLEVESIDHTGPQFKSVMVVHIQEIKQHPNADKLTLVTVTDGEHQYEVVCGAKNTSVGDYVPLAQVNSQVLDRKTNQLFELKPTVIRGIESQGMLCSLEELGLADKFQQEEGIFILNRFFPNISPRNLGDSLVSFLNLEPETILHVAPTANRGDLMSMQGVAKEVSAIFARKLTLSHRKAEYQSKCRHFNVKIVDEETCQYYALGILKNLRLGQSPDWLVKRLELSGMRSINNIVDITNYVMLEYGQPLHAFDLDKLPDKYLCVRYAKENETLITLDNNERKLTSETVVIANSSHPVAIAGVMGGRDSEITNETINIVLESAYFDPAKTRKSSQSIALRTEASARFERGIDIGSVKQALLQAIKLLEEYAHAEFVDISETGNDDITTHPITLRYKRLNEILGITIQPDRCLQILESLGFSLLNHNESQIDLAVPSHRMNDVYREIDIIEEIIRVYGYDKLPETIPAFHTTVNLPLRHRLTNKISHMLVGYGFKEIMTSSLIGQELISWANSTLDNSIAVKVANPQSDDYTTLRQSLLPNLLKVIKYNMDRDIHNLALFEMGKNYVKTQVADKLNSGVTETKCLSLAMAGKLNNAQWRHKTDNDFYTLKGVIDSILREFKISDRVEFEETSLELLHPGRSATLTLKGKGGKHVLGVLGELHPKVAASCDFNTTLYIAELNFDKILEQSPFKEIKFKQLPKHPLVERDISFWVHKNVSYHQLKTTILKAKTKYLKDMQLFDIYEDNHQPDDISLAIRIYLQNLEQTLTEPEIEQDVLHVKKALEDNYKVKLR